MPVSDSLSICLAAGAPQLCRSIALAVSSTSSGSLSTLSACAGKSAPHCMREFYGYNPVTYSISLGITDTDFFGGGQIEFNTLTASGAWTASKADPDNIIGSYTTSGSGSQKVTAASSNTMPFFPAFATITYRITASPTTSVTWSFYWDGF